MELYQANIFGGKEEVIEKHNPEYKPKKLSKKDQILKQKLSILYKLYEKLYNLQEISILEQREVILKKDLVIYPDERQAEPIETVQLNIENHIDKKIEVAQEKYKQLQL